MTLVSSRNQILRKLAMMEHLARTQTRPKNDPNQLVIPEVI